MPEYPWEYNQELTKSRIVELANFISQVRAEVIERHDDDLGDTPLSLGMRCYECCRTRIIEKAQDDAFPWLTILTNDKRFTFGFGDDKVPVRFTRNDPKYLPEKKLLVSEAAQHQYDIFNKSVIPYAELRWYVVFDTYYKNPADSVFFVGYSEHGEVVCQWQVPMDDNVILLSEVLKDLPQPVEQDKPRLGIKTKTKTKKDSGEDKNKLDSSRNDEG